MESTVCPGCCARGARVAELERRVAVLEARLGANSTNSSVPPSANPLGAPEPAKKKKSKRKPGGRPGHPPHLKALVPPERVNHTVAFAAAQGGRCQAPLPREPSPQDPAATRFQVVELPPLVAVVTEYPGQARTCPGCGAVTRHPIPRELLAHSVGPRLTATLSYFAGCHGASKRGAEAISQGAFDAPVALGTVANLEQEVSAALAAPHREAVTAVRAAAVKHADETSWKLRGRLGWLWTAATAKVAAVLIHARRGAAGLTALLGAAIAGILCSDRRGAYGRVPAKRRPSCRAHLERDFQKALDRGGPSAFVGRRGRILVKKVFAAWQAFREGQTTRAQRKGQLAPLMNRMQRLLLEGAILREDARVAAFCENLLALEPALWTFAEVEGVGPTPNFMERLLRRAVLWRKRSFGSWSAAGCRFVERILTVVQTCRPQGRHALDYMQEALVAHRSGQPCPKLLPEG